MASGVLDHRTRYAVAEPDPAVIEAKVRKTERQVWWRYRLYRAKRWLARWWPHVALVVSIALLLREYFR